MKASHCRSILFSWAGAAALVALPAHAQLEDLFRAPSDKPQATQSTVEVEPKVSKPTRLAQQAQKDQQAQRIQQAQQAQQAQKEQQAQKDLQAQRAQRAQRIQQARQAYQAQQAQQAHRSTTQAASPANPSAQVALDEKVIIYTKPACPQCIRALKHMQNRRIAFVQKDIQNNRSNRAEFKRIGGRDVPHILMGNIEMAGFNPKSFDGSYAAWRAKTAAAH